MSLKSLVAQLQPEPAPTLHSTDLPIQKCPQKNIPNDTFLCLFAVCLMDASVSSSATSHASPMLHPCVLYTTANQSIYLHLKLSMVDWAAAAVAAVLLTCLCCAENRGQMFCTIL